VGLWLAPAGIGLGLAAGIFSTLIIEIAGSAGGSSLAHPSPAVSLAADFAFDLSFVAAALYLTILQGRMGRRDFGYRRVGWGIAAAGFVAAGIAYYAVTFLYSSLLSLHARDRLPTELGVNRSVAALVATAVFVCVVAPVCEEFFFRGFLFGILRRIPITVAGRSLGPWLAALIVGVLFGLAHSGSAPGEYLVPLGFLGFVLCLLRWRTGSLYPCMALHAFNNALALGVDRTWNGGEIAGLIAGSLALIALLTFPLSRARD
jgi:membrane protease YdiL (CAAX protease family)